MDYTGRMRNSHLTGDLKLVAEQVGEWAQRQDSIVRLWLLGSHARPADAPVSDLDIAYEVDAPGPGAADDGSAGLRGRWIAELSDATGLDTRFDSIAAERIQSAVTDHGVLIYERVGAPPCRWLA
jgi:predicted nucleotidyltransferase